MKFHENLKDAKRFMTKRNKLPDSIMHVEYMKLIYCGEVVATLNKIGQISFERNLSFDAIINSDQWDNGSV